MYVIELKTGEWFCSESKKEIEKIIGKIKPDFDNEALKNCWFQPFNYLSGVMSDFFLIVKDGKLIENNPIPMRGWINNLPLTECKKGNVTFLGKKMPKWYLDVLNNK